MLCVLCLSRLADEAFLLRQLFSVFSPLRVVFDERMLFVLCLSKLADEVFFVEPVRLAAAPRPADVTHRH